MKYIKIKKNIIVFAVLVCLMGIFTACGDNIDSEEVSKEETTAELLSEDELEGVTFKRGDMFVDMSVTTPDGTVYKISELLKEKKAVVINFWYLNCEPCKMEFSYMQEAYETFKDDIEILAINPCDGTDATVKEFQQQTGLTFLMAVCDAKWEQYMGITAYPTTVVIDRYGIVSFKHTGMITETEVFNKLFAFYTAEDYEQTVIRNISDIE